MNVSLLDFSTCKKAVSQAQYIKSYWGLKQKVVIKVKYKVKTCQNFKMYIEFYLPTL